MKHKRLSIQSKQVWLHNATYMCEGCGKLVYIQSYSSYPEEEFEFECGLCRVRKAFEDDTTEGI